MALGLPGDDQRVEFQQLVHQTVVLPVNGPSVRAVQHLGPQHRIILGERVAALDLEARLAVARQVVEEQCLLDRRDQAVADAAENRVVGPDHQQVLARLAQPAAVVQQVPLQGVDVAARHAAGDRRIYLPDTVFNILHRYRRHRLRMLAVCVHQEHRVEDLHGGMGVEGGMDLGNRREVAVDEGAQAGVVFDRAAPRTTAHEQLEIRQAEGVLHVDGQQANPFLVGSRRRDAVFPGPGRRLPRAFAVRHAPHVAHRVGIEMVRHGKLAPVHRCTLH